jgi:uncharacterized ferredoxin-like protein
MDESIKTIIAVIIIILYLIGVSLCACGACGCNPTCDRCKERCKNFNYFGDRVDDEPRIYYDEM